MDITTKRVKGSMTTICLAEVLKQGIMNGCLPSKHTDRTSINAHDGIGHLRRLRYSLLANINWHSDDIWSHIKITI